MNFKQFTGVMAGFFLLSAAALAAPTHKGVVNTLDVTTGNISINYRNMQLTDNTRVLAADGKRLVMNNLATRQYVSYSVNELDEVSEIRIYDPQKLKEQGFYTGNELNH